MAGDLATVLICDDEPSLRELIRVSLVGPYRFAEADDGEESLEIARRLRQMATAGLPFDRAAVLLRDPERYQPFLEEALRRAGIPAHFSRGVVRPDPGGRAFLALGPVTGGRRDGGDA